MKIEANSIEELIKILNNKSPRKRVWDSLDDDENYLYVIDYTENESVNHYSYVYENGIYTLKHEF